MIKINREIFNEYEDEVQKVALLIKDELEKQDGGPINGRDWCDEYDVPENVFADAINWNDEWFDWGISPMHPWIYYDYESGK